MKLNVYLFVIVPIVMAGTFFACGGDTKEPKEIIRPVRYQQVFLSTGGQTRTFTGISKAGTEARLSFRVGGTVLSVNVKVGDRIEKGKLIVSIDDSDARLNYDKSLVALTKSRIQKETAKSNLDRVKGLYENNNVPLREYESAKEKYATTNSAYNADKSNADLQKRQLGYYKLYSPMTGIAASVAVKKNENVQAGQMVVEVNAGDDIEVTVGMPESFIAGIKAGESAGVRFSSIPGKVFDGKVSEVSYTVNSQSSTYPVTVMLDHPTSDIRPGMSADVTFTFGTENENENPVVPPHAVGKDSGGNFIFTVSATGDGFAVVRKKPVKVGRLGREGFEILSGLQDGELVVTAGIAKLSDQMKVRLLK
ncbi:MAG: efflux RND transporter periplasmic adaptor subunit [bacterium]|nr:efflux RND transporter periplasmic adaptor subunit [bacterium]